MTSGRNADVYILDIYFLRTSSGLYFRLWDLDTIPLDSFRKCYFIFIWNGLSFPSQKHSSAFPPLSKTNASCTVWGANSTEQSWKLSGLLPWWSWVLLSNKSVVWVFSLEIYIFFNVESFALKYLVTPSPSLTLSRLSHHSAALSPCLPAALTHWCLVRLDRHKHDIDPREKLRVRYFVCCIDKDTGKAIYSDNCPVVWANGPWFVAAVI